MRLRILLPLLLVLFCASQSIAQKSIKVRTTILHLVDRSAVGPETTTTEYFAENGGLERSVTNSNESKDKEELTFTLDEKGNWVKSKTSLMDFTMERALEYNDKDSIVREISSFGSIEYKYNDSDYLKQKIHYKQNGEIESTTDYTYKDGKLVNVTGHLVSMKNDGDDVYLKIDYKYDSFGMLTKTERSKIKGNGFAKHIEIREYKYDGQGRVTTEIQTDQMYYSESGSPAVSYYRIEYSYNPEGYPSRKSYYTEDRRLEKYDEILYTYY